MPGGSARWSGGCSRALIDGGFRGASEERLLLRSAIVAQAHRGPDGAQAGGAAGRAGRGRPGLRARLGERDRDDGCGPARGLGAGRGRVFALPARGRCGSRGRRRLATLQLAPPETIELDGVARECDVLRARIAPGLGLSEGDELALYIDRDGRLMRRVRFSLERLDGTKGAVAEVDTFDHVERAGVRWPTRFRAADPGRCRSRCTTGV